MSEYITHSREETVALGRKLAAVLPDGTLIAFTGGLGAGKTAFCEGLAAEAQIHALQKALAPTQKLEKPEGSAVK